MAYFLSKQFGNYREYIVDAEADLTSVPTDDAEPGSIAIVLEPTSGHSQQRMLNTEGDWQEILTPPTTIGA